MDWKVRYLIRYPDMDRVGESKAYSRRNALEWVLVAPISVFEVELFLGPKRVGLYKRDKRNKMRRVME